MGSQHIAPALTQGMLVSFEIPSTNTVGKELFGRQLGVILSHNMHCSTSNTVLVAPFLRSPDPHHELLGITAAPGGVQGWVRPDLTRSTGRDLCSPLRLKSSPDGHKLVLPPEIVRQATERLLAIVRPEPGKMAGGQSPLRYGSLAWFRSIPRPDQPDVTDRAPALCLTPGELYRKTGIALVSRRFTNPAKIHPRYDVVTLSPGFSLGFHSASLLYALSLDRVISASPRPFLDVKALKGMEHKLAGCIDKAAFAQVAARYPDQTGILPDFIVEALRQPQDKRKFRVSTYGR